MTAKKSILIDAREWDSGRITGIGRMLTGCVAALVESPLIERIVLALTDAAAVDPRLRERDQIARVKIPGSFLKSEWALSELTKGGFDVFISPYPKLPLFGVHCPPVHTIHDVMDLTDPLYGKRLKTFFDKYRLKKALHCANLTWYDSRWSMKETKGLAGSAGRNPRVRYLGIDDHFNDTFQSIDLEVLGKYALKSKEYILVIGNGLPHKNLGLLLGISEQIHRKFIFVGVSKHNQNNWGKRYPTNQARWIEYVEDSEMPAFMKHAFCLSQPSLAEGYGYPPLEAMACGTPAVVSNIEVLVETTGGHALIGEPHDGQSWLKAFECLENRNVYHTRVQQGLQWVANLKGLNGWKGHVADIEELMGRKR